MAEITEPKLSATELADYVRASARLQALPLGAAQIERVAGHLARTHAMAALLHAAEISPHDEPAEVFCPAPFPSTDASVPAPQTATRAAT